jgi:hypothetical protein
MALSVFSCSFALAEELAVPVDAIVLTVSGDIAVTNNTRSAQFDLAMLEALEKTEIKTSTIWTEGEQTFEGVSLAALVERLGIEGDTLRATAINDYAVEIPITDAIEGRALVAYRMNGKPMSVREKGPLWIVYPFDLNADFRTEVIYTRSIWQLDRIETSQ